MRRIGIVAGTLLLAAGSTLGAQSLKGSRASVYRQHHQALAHDYTFLRSTQHVHKFVRLGLLVPVRGNGTYRPERVSFPYARPELRLFVERLSKQYHAACGERIVVTSLVRPLARQPRNASDLSVHPAGMAVDLRRSARPACRRWLERTLLGLEARGVLDATYERRPPHYHVAVFSERYRRYVAAITGSSQLSAR